MKKLFVIVAVILLGACTPERLIYPAQAILAVQACAALGLETTNFTVNSSWIVSYCKDGIVINIPTPQKRSICDFRN